MANPYFNAQYYLQNNPDLVLAGITVETAEAHYTKYGAFEESKAGAPRLPNAWFDASFYLQSNPDLIAAGLTLGQALDHYAQYGIFEGRAFSDDADLDPSEFDASAYAAANEDLRTAFGIEDASDLTAEQTADLLGHYLAYGLYESRTTGQTGDFANLVGQSQAAPIAVTAGTVAVGTQFDDTFTLDAGTVATATVNGVAGDDTLVITGAGATAVRLISVENVAINSAADVTVTGTGVETLSFTNASGASYAGALVSDITIGALTTGVEFAFTGVTGSSDNLSLNLAADANVSGGVAVSGVETVDLDLAATVDSDGNFVSAGQIAQLNANGVEGSSLTVNITGGNAASTNSLTVESFGSAELATVTIDGSDYLGGQTLTAGASLANVNVTINGGAGKDLLSTSTAAGHTATLNGGAGDDTLVASLGQDILTGGAGNDVFQFTTANSLVSLNASGEIAGVDTITDFSAGDSIELTAPVATADIANVGEVGDNGLVSFQTGFLAANSTLTAVVTALSENAASGEQVLFKFGADAYAFVADGNTGDIAGDSLIKLTGVDVTKLVANGTTIEFAV
ncbi:hypothetical protein CEK29_22330 [Bordetella genomosp. 5]|uniref:hypothetical protein n=1 Tax=Bordetella genomosp. 5 TaxID=1395608 RepID=UPI000B9E1AE5|nr:hypothetical protein [Bordetella genomosp. 5]OZI33585.1 hypothetical protein CEK29_22330 [Bordetella genomosp. 5]